MSSGVFDSLDRCVEGAAKILTVLAMILLVPMMFLVAGDVIGRYVFKSPIPAVFEVNTNFLMVMVVFFPMAYVHVMDQHVFVTLFTEKLPARVKALLDAFSVLLGATIYALIGWYGASVALKATKVQEYSPGIIDVPVWMAKWIVPIGAFVFSVELLFSAIKHMRTMVNPDAADVGDAPGLKHHG
ncbi:MAG: TRAP transporter small permease [Deltaproteobacteria bacterium]|nr:TRAP transporter small permease [Deltaproteobacteria bacterium]